MQPPVGAGEVAAPLRHQREVEGDARGLACVATLQPFGDLCGPGLVAAAQQRPRLPVGRRARVHAQATGQRHGTGDRPGGRARVRAKVQHAPDEPRLGRCGRREGRAAHGTDDGRTRFGEAPPSPQPHRPRQVRLRGQIGRAWRTPQPGSGGPACLRGAGLLGESPSGHHRRPRRRMPVRPPEGAGQQPPRLRQVTPLRRASQRGVDDERVVLGTRHLPPQPCGGLRGAPQPEPGLRQAQAGATLQRGRSLVPRHRRQVLHSAADVAHGQPGPPAVKPRIR